MGRLLRSVSASRADTPAMQELQEVGHEAEHDYRSGSPHLKHWHLRDWLVDLLHQEVVAVSSAGLAPTLLEIGAGHGGYTEPALAFGCVVTATEMSRPSLSKLEDRYSLNSRLSLVFDPDGSLTAVDAPPFSLALCASVLHHIPDYLSFLEASVLKQLAVGGSLLSIQDPLWYPDMRRSDHLVSKLAYFSWRITQGRIPDGARTRLRRLRGIYEADNPLDMVEYHVIRHGVDQNGIADALSSRFDSLTILPYWSTQSALWQRGGEMLGRTNTFALVARGFRG